MFRFQRIVLAGWLCLCGGMGYAEETPEKVPVEDTFEAYRVLIDTIDQVDRNYVGQLSKRELIDAAIEGVLKKLDPYSDYISPERMESFRKNVDSKFGGIGVMLNVDGDKIVVVSPLVNTPAYRAGVFSGDVILEVDGESVVGFSADEVSQRMKGEIGTTLTLKLLREGNPKPFTLTVERDMISMETVSGFDRLEDDSWNYWMDAPHGIAYVAISSFGQDTATQLREVLENLQKPTEEGGEPALKALILDLRFNPGGILPVAIDVCDLFLEDGVIVSIQGRNTEERVWKAKKDDSLLEKIPMTVLINHYSASASEIVAACLQDHGRAVVIGERSWGKGSVQNVMELEDGNSALKLTTAGYHRPNGKNIHRAEDATESDEWGVVPQEEFYVAMTPEQQGRLAEDQRRRHELRTHQVNENPAWSQRGFEDPQLQKAMEVLEGELKTNVNVQALLRKRLNPTISYQDTPVSPARTPATRGWRRR
ncbi:MAG: S41 family peptidase [Planctomycetia bacterium]|nr:S41 family peptidase [Planctomycetia bacterium]